MLLYGICGVNKLIKIKDIGGKLVDKLSLMWEQLIHRFPLVNHLFC